MTNNNNNNIVAIMANIYEINLDVKDVPEKYSSALVNVHAGLSVHEGLLVGKAIIPEDYLAQDINFALAHNLPPENTASRLETYKPQNPSQERLLRAASFIAGATHNIFMGLWSSGPAGVGKSHIAIGLAKAIALKSYDKIDYFNVPTTRMGSITSSTQKI